MTEPKEKQPIDLDSKMKKLENEIKELRKRLDDRNPAFNGNLLKKSDQELTRLKMAIGESIKQVVGQDLLYVFKHKKMLLDFDSLTYGSKGWCVHFESEDEKKIRDNISDLQMRKFQESLDNFAWAVKNQNNC